MHTKVGSPQSLAGREYGRWNVTRFYAILTGQDTRSRILWLCRCQCGNLGWINGDKLRSGWSKSCGCYRDEAFAERVRQRAKGRFPKGHSPANKGKPGAPSKNKTHGESESPLYAVWCGMKGRCNQKTHISYKWYGARGIQVCELWQKSYEAFRDWSLSHGYEKGLNIDRIDNDGHYSPENCRFVTKGENLRGQHVRRSFLKKIITQ